MGEEIAKPEDIIVIGGGIDTFSALLFFPIRKNTFYDMDFPKAF